MPYSTSLLLYSAIVKTIFSKSLQTFTMLLKTLWGKEELLVTMFSTFLRTIKNLRSNLFVV